MKISELTGNETSKVDLDLKIIWDKSDVRNFGTDRVKPVRVVDKDETSRTAKSAYLDLKNQDIDAFKFMDKIKVIGASVKLIPGNNDIRLKNYKSITKVD